MQNVCLTIEDFLRNCRQPALSEAGEELMPLDGANLTLEQRNGGLVLQAWDDRRNLVRRVAAVESQTRARLVLKVERFPRRAGTLTLLDLSRSDKRQVGLQTARLEFQEVFRRFLRREFVDVVLEEVSTAPNLEESLSPAYPRAFLRRGARGLAAIAAPAESSVDGILSFGLIWLDYLRRRERGMAVEGLVLFLPAGKEINTKLRLRWLNPAAARCFLYLYREDGQVEMIDQSDAGNISTKLEGCRRAPNCQQSEVNARLTAIPGVESVELSDGGVSFRVRGLEFARLAEARFFAGLETKRERTASHISEVIALAEELVRFRSPDAAETQHPLWLRNREAWLESQVRANLEDLDPTLHRTPIYGQVPAFAAGDRGVLDLLAVDRDGRLAVIELKASQDIHLPLQALDYWLRVKWHLDRGEFTACGYFPGRRLLARAPRLLLVAPSLEFHPSNERILRFFSPQVEVERLGVGVEWQRRCKIMYRY